MLVLWQQHVLVGQRQHGVPFKYLFLHLRVLPKTLVYLLQIPGRQVTVAAAVVPLRVVAARRILALQGQQALQVPFLHVREMYELLNPVDVFDGHLLLAVLLGVDDAVSTLTLDVHLGLCLHPNSEQRKDQTDDATYHYKNRVVKLASKPKLKTVRQVDDAQHSGCHREPTLYHDLSLLQQLEYS